MKTAMQELKEKCQVVVDEMKDVVKGTEEYGYRLAIQNVIKDIDAQMMEKEKQQIIEAREDGVDMITHNEKFVSSESYYNENFNL